ncbi:hypothetical protein MLD38_004444 [Melastoma candidum]|uniref:Uncharacterized protein n=1 Tax=Melastoma candidum TaxID=119954 RepID=A0ACB9S7M6_9MYRT|nr:hypothetical protein MLD38_004444 [Melastoma candidum]
MASVVSSFLAVLCASLVLWHAPSRASPIPARSFHDSLHEELGYSFGAQPYYLSHPFFREDVVSIKASTFPRASDIGASMTASSLAASSSMRVVTVDSFGAKADGKHDDTLAFQKAWTEACSTSKGAVLLVPNKNYLIGPITFSGPCQSNIFLQMKGSIKASADQSDYQNDWRHWILLKNVANLVVDGGSSGKIDGNGKIWWQNSCKVDESLPCKSAPTAMTFYGCNNLRVQNLKIQNAQQIHTSFEKCNIVNVSGIQVTAPADSPNTDGIHVTGTQNIHISNCVISTGDDCISIVAGSQKVYAKNITCGPGHGISIGSLGSDNSAAYVSGVYVDGAKLTGTTNGVRIKTWQGGSGSASQISFKNIQMQSVSNPIIIDQNYCDQAQPCENQRSAVQVKGVVYENIKGTSATDMAVRFSCSSSVPCRGITMQDISLRAVDGSAVKASCDNVDVKDHGNVSPLCPS